jgi:hypothetical protein
VDRVIADMSCMEQLVASQMLLAAATWLRHVKSIATTYRMTARPPPSKPSHYAASLLRTPMVRLISIIASCTAHKAFHCCLLPSYTHSVRAVFCTEVQPADNLQPLLYYSVLSCIHTVEKLQTAGLVNCALVSMATAHAP